MIKGIIFDYDGVIADTLIPSYKIINTLLEKYGLRKFSSLEEFRNSGIADWKKTLFDMGFTAEDLKEAPEIFIEEAKKREDEFRIFDGIEELFNRLHERFRFGIVSNGHTERIKCQLRRQGLLEFFSCIIGLEATRIKPDPHQIVACMDSMSIKPRESCFVGDTEVDIQAGKNAQVAKIIAVSYGYQSEEKLTGADIIAHSPKELLKILEELR